MEKSQQSNGHDQPEEFQEEASAQDSGGVQQATRKQP
jgi:hypothetical protein